jgi:EpsI family protein
MDFLKGKYVRVVSLLLLVQAAAYYAVASRPEQMPVVRPLAEFPSDIGPWRTVRDVQVEPEVQEVLRADDILNRVYAGAGPVPAFLFVAFFKTQRMGQAPHSPKNCLPGSGWEPSETGFLDLQPPGRPEPIRVNRYVVSHGDEKSVVLYWYQSHKRVIASEYAAKFWLVADSVRYHRSDTALIRIVVPVVNNDTASATKTGVDFIQAAYPALHAQLPS